MANKPPTKPIRDILKREIGEENRIPSGLELLVYVDYLNFMKKLSREATKVAVSHGSSKIDAVHVDLAAKTILGQYKAVVEKKEHSHRNRH